MQKRVPGNSGLEVSADDLHQLEEALAHIRVQGDRCPPQLAARVNG